MNFAGWTRLIDARPRYADMLIVWGAFPSKSAYERSVAGMWLHHGKSSIRLK